jgi:hypothetical protein
MYLILFEWTVLVIRGIGDAEKPYLRRTLLELIREEDNKVKYQVLPLLYVSIVR